ncbi:hypothetical protein B9Z55_028683 [Caenorhabditis nigoni]|uniref:DUF7154 domain-containing protein n=1 Tax=Caenorhabditis nigoni TaxID=1611254 RepID=A0A2G5SAX3_9PELO|nr:hypothetical protein B9Z55_028683 [Caenorhabditis nigoni]
MFSVTATTFRTAPDSTSTYTTTSTHTTTKIPITRITRIPAQTSAKTSTNLEKTTVASSTGAETTYTTTQPQMTTSTSDTSCNSTTFPSTFLFAYSNDLSSDTVLDTFHQFSSYLKYYYWFGSKFFSNTQTPVCGSIIAILLKRYNNEADVSRLVSLIRYHHAIVHVMISATPSGGSQPKAMYSVASKTNGMGMVEYDKHFPDAIDWVPLFIFPYPIYAVTIPVSGNGTKTLPDFYPPSASMYWIGITYQDHVPIDTFQYFKFGLTYDQGNCSFSVNSREVSIWDDGNYYIESSSLMNLNYKITMDYNYLGRDVQHLQFRIYTIM